MAFINTVYELRKQNPEAAAYVDELVAEGMEPLAAFEQAKREYGIGTLDAPAVSSDLIRPFSLRLTSWILLCPPLARRWTIPL